MLLGRGRATQHRPVLRVAIPVADQGIQEQVAGEHGEGVELGRSREVRADDLADIAERVPAGGLAPWIVLILQELAQERRAWS